MGELRGERYLIEGDEESERLAGWIRETLWTLDYDETISAYAILHPVMRPEDKALLACNDRYYLLTHLLHRKDALHPWLLDRCREVEAEPDGHLDLWSREHYKSTIITFAGSIQEILIDPEITIGIFSHTRGIAQGFLSQIMQELATNDELKECFPDVLWAEPKKQAPKWSKQDGIIVKRSSNPKEATVEAWGLVDGQPTSKHFKILNYDDVITDRNVTNPEQIKKTTEAWELSNNLGTSDGRVRTAGTRYSFANTYGVMLERGIFIVRIFPATEDGKITGKPVFWTQEVWDRKIKMQRSTAAAQLLQNPLAGKENTFSVEWFRPWMIRPATLNVYIMCDPSRGRSASSDNTAMVVIGVDAAKNKYLLDGFCHRMTLSERWENLLFLHQKWSNEPGVQTIEVGYERYGQQSDDEYFTERMNAGKISFPIKELNWTRDGRESKTHRVERLEPDFRDSDFYLPGVVYHVDHGGDCLWKIEAETDKPIKYRALTNPTREMVRMEALGQKYLTAKPIKRRDADGNLYDLTRVLMEEMLFFPFAPRDDLVDATSRIYDMDISAPAIYEDRDIEQPDFADA